MREFPEVHMDDKNKPFAGLSSRTLAGLFLLALCVRLVHGVFFVGLQTIPPGDASEYLAYADNLAAGLGYTAWGSQAFRPPGYPFFAAGVFYAFGKSIPALKLLQILISSAIPVLTAVIGSRLLSRTAGALAGLYACFYYGLFSEPSTIMSEATFTFLFTLTVLLMLRAREGFLRGGAAGVSLALAILTRPVALLTVPIFLAWLFLVLDRRSFIRTGAAVAAACVLAMSPWWARNYRVFGHFVPVCLETGGVMENTQVPLDLRTPERYEGLSEYEKDRLKTRDALAHVARRGPAAFLKQGLTRLSVFFYPFTPGYDVTWAFMVPFWLLGMYAVLRMKDRRPWILFVFSICFPIYFVFCATTRYKYSVSQFMILFAAAGFLYLYDKYRRNPVLYAALSGWALANLLVWLNAPFFRAAALRLKG